MSTLQFPKNPSINDEYDWEGFKYVYDGQKWKTIGVGYNPVNDLKDKLEPRIDELEDDVTQLQSGNSSLVQAVDSLNVRVTAEEKDTKDWEVFTAELLAQAGIVDDGQPDKLGASQRVEAICVLDTISQNQVIGGIVYPESGDLSVGMIVPPGTTHLRIDSNVCEMYPVQIGTVTAIDSVFNEVQFAGIAEKSGYRSIGRENHLKLQNQRLTAEYSRKLRMHENVTVVWYGDSNSEAFSNGVQSGFRGVLNNVYGTASTTHSRAVSGRTAEWTFKLESAFVNSDLSIIALGTNDGIANRFSSYLDEISTYEFWMRKLIEREINWGNPVAIVTPLPMRFDKEFESYAVAAPTDPSGSDARPDIAVLRGIAERLAADYGCQLFDTAEWASRYNDDMFNNQTQSIGGPQAPFGDSIHLKTAYITAWGQNIAYSLICDNAIKRHSVVGGDTIQIRKGTDPIVFSQGVGVFPYSWGGDGSVRFASGDTLLNERVAIVNVGNVASFAFYAEQPMIVYPVLYNIGGNTVVSVNNYQPLSQRSVDVDKERLTKSAFGGSSSVSIPASTLVTTKTNAKPCKLYHRGWHIIQVAPQSGATCWLSGLVFEQLDTKLSIDTASALAASKSITTLGASNDLNTIKITGNYFAGDNVINKFWPNGNTCFVEVIFNEWGTTGIQRATRFNGDQYVRQFSGGSWGAARTFAST